MPLQCEMDAPDKTEMKTKGCFWPLKEYKITLWGVPVCMAAPDFKKECFAPELLEKERLCQNCEFFPEIFRRLLAQTGFLLATMGVGYPVAFGNPTGPR